MRLVVVIVQAAGAPEVPEDRCAMICRQAGIERRRVCGGWLGVGRSVRIAAC